MNPLSNWFPLKYRDDPGLAFMQFCAHDDLKDLADILMTKKGSKRWTEQLSTDRRFVANKEDLTKSWDVIAAELQRFGSDTVLTTFKRGKGALYKNVLRDVCKKMKVKFSTGDEMPIVEGRILVKVLERAIEKMNAAERAEFAKWMAEEFAHGQFDIAKATPTVMAATLQTAIAAGGFASYQVTVIVANAVAKTVLNRGLSFAANAALTRTVALFAGPIGWAISAVLAVPIVTGPAFRVTVPAVIFVSYLRQKHLNKDIL